MSSTRASRRSRQQSDTRESIIASADALFLDRGYAGTTISMIAREADAAVQTVYNAVGGKAAILSAVLDRRASGTDGRPVVEFLAERLDAASDADDVVRVLADWLSEVNVRTYPVHRVIAQGAAVDADLAALQTRRAQQRLERYGRTGQLLRARGGLRSGLSDHDVAATIWSIGSPAAYEALVIDGGWAIDAHRQWIERALRAALLG
ncbi:TetR/AcrR family transcriptional regulator [Microbacterium sp. NPDC089987]|uniref:TetR/AcrR family transcriptional regulator n=1 Tax=Microbacterium sp. NPDC089987 TaxID=3364202 RepID=UPI003812D7DA